MARAKLSADDQAKLVALYRESDVTATALADHFSVSNSTVSRILREAIPAAEYRRLSRQKRSSDAATPTLFEDTAQADTAAVEVSPDTNTTAAANVPPEPRSKPRRSKVTQAVEADTTEAVAAEPEVPSPVVAEVSGTSVESELSIEPQLDAVSSESAVEPEQVADAEPEEVIAPELIPELVPAPLRPKPVKRVIAPIEAAAPVETDPEPDDDTDDDEPSFPPGLDFTPEDDDDDEDEDDSDSSDDDSSPEEPVSVDVQSLEGFEYPDLGYTLIDKYQELVTSPLSAFVEQAPPELANAITLPVFDTHRGARRYSHQVRGKQNKYRVLTFPGNYLERTRIYLQAKGITHVIMNHQVYEL